VTNISSRTADAFPALCLSIDLEVGKQNNQIHQFAAVRSDNGEAFVFKKGALSAALSDLDAFARPAAMLLGHNLIAFDIPRLAAAEPGLRLLKLPLVDTLWLSPLAFPRNPYHHLIKHYQDGGIRRGSLNDPELDARLALEVFSEEVQALKEADPDLLTAWHWLTTADGASPGFDSVFASLRKRRRPSDGEAAAAIEALLNNNACLFHARGLLADAHKQGWALSYALAWLSVAGGNSVMAPWVNHQFPEAGKLVRLLRNVPCENPACAWCRERHDARKELGRWFGFSEFRPEPIGPDGRPLQQTIVEAAMRGEHLLAILPTGGGKSLCYQIPALSRYDKTGELTVVVSPLVALMADQVAGMEARGIFCCAAINGLLSMPERAQVLDRIRLGGVGILLVSPEQLRNRTLRKTLAQRQIGGWVLDEAHCISEWGHAFRPDYRYVARFIKEKTGAGPLSPILCLSATAKPEVVGDIRGHFRGKLGIDMKLLDGGARRSNLEFEVIATTPGEKFAHVHQVLSERLPADIPGGAIVYCASRRQTEEVAEFLCAKELSAGYYHAGLRPEAKKEVQEAFIHGGLRVICATNAFGMGIDKPDVRLVVHADIAGSLENYMQEAGRAGRDRKAAACVLLYTPEDVERQFGMSARSRLTRREIQSVLRSLRRLDQKKRLGGEVVATAGEILAEDEEGEFERDSATDDTRVRTAVAWLEEAALLSREENQVQVFPSSLRVSSIAEAKAKLDKLSLFAEQRRRLLSLVEALIAADPDEGISTDQLMGQSGLSAEKLRGALQELERCGLASNDTALTAFVHSGVERSSAKRFSETVALERALIEAMREAAPELGKGDSSPLHLRLAAQRLRDAGCAHAQPERLKRILRSLAEDGRGEDGGVGSLKLGRIDAEAFHVKLQRDWTAIMAAAERRRTAAQRLLEHILSRVPKEARGLDLLAATTMSHLFAALEQDLVIKAETRNLSKLLERALLWLHEQEILKLNKGLAVFRPAMTLRLALKPRGFVKSDFVSLQRHYDEQVTQIHVMGEYAQRGLRVMADAVRMAMDYFSQGRDEFLRNWMAERAKDLNRQTTPESWRRIIDSLENPVQQQIVADDREQTNVLVLAGPGSGKTRVLVHRIAYLIRVRRENPHGILALAYNHHAAAEIRRRLGELIGDDAKGVITMTLHALAMRLVGVSFAGRAARMKDDSFQDVLREAVALLKGTGLPPEEADAQRDRLLAGFRWILVDEYQDIDAEKYQLISALAGRTLQDEDSRQSLFAVGDDDQNIYSFNGASVEFIRAFEKDYAARPAFLTDNYRCTGHILSAANLVISPAGNRMKAERPITIDRARRSEPGGGAWERLDPVGQGRVQILPAGGDERTQAVAVMTELRRLSRLDPHWDWAKAAVISRGWSLLEPVRGFCALHGIPAQFGREEAVRFWKLRETQALLDWLRSRKNRLIDCAAIGKWLSGRPPGGFWKLISEAVAAYAQESGGTEFPVDNFIEWLAEWGRELRRKQTGLLLLSAHGAKGREFDHVVVLDGRWGARGEDADAERRLFYVAMTRARKTLTLAKMKSPHLFLDPLRDQPSLLRRAPIALPEPPPELGQLLVRLSLKDVDMGFAGRHLPDDGVHGAIRELSPGDPIQLRGGNGGWDLFDDRGRMVGRLAQAFTPPKNAGFLSGSVGAIGVHRRGETEERYRGLVRCERWEIVVPELRFVRGEGGV